MKVVMPKPIENATTEAEIASNALYTKYQELFDEFTDTYGSYLLAQDPPMVVDDLISYFQALDLITLLSDPNATLPIIWTRPQGDPPARPKNKFYRLPLDEPYFEINTDTRTISVPTEFASNGLGVKGDANAEIVFFKCPRLFDSVDLYPMVEAGNCYIQWTNSNAKVSGNSQAILCDANPEYMFIGWMITNKMTTYSGNLDFSVRWFVTEGEGDAEKITYSISTQTATCSIKGTMDLDLQKIEVEKMDDLVKTRPIYTHVINSMEGLSPRISTQLVTGNYDLEAIDPEDDELLELYPVEDYPDGIYIFEVSATSPDGKDITYQWYKGSAALANENKAKFTATAPGTYHVIIGNGDTDGYRYVTSPNVVVPAPEQIQYVNNELNKFFGYGAYSPSTDNVNDKTILSADITTTNEEAPNGTVEVEWYRAPMVSNNTLVADVDHATFAKVGDTQKLVKQTAKTYVTSTCNVPKNDEAWYKCKAVNRLNNSQSEIIEPEDVITVRAKPTRPSSVTIAYVPGEGLLGQLRVTNVSFPEGSPSKFHPSELHYQWNDGTAISASGGGNGFGDEFKVLNITEPASDCEIAYNVRVSHRVFNGNKVDADADAATAVQDESGFQVSNTITLSFVFGGNQHPTVTVAD